MPTKQTRSEQNVLVELMQRAAKGDRDAFAHIYEAFLTPVYQYVYLRIRHKQTAEDLTQTVFLKVFASLERYVYRGRPPLAYFFTVARNAIIDHQRKKQTQMEEANDELLVLVEDDRDRPEDAAERELLSAHVRSALAKLNADQQEVVILRFVHDLTHSTIAEIMGKSEEAVRQIQSRAMKELRGILAYEQE